MQILQTNGPPAGCDRDSESAAPEVFCELVTKKEIKALFHAAGLNGVRFLGLREQEAKNDLNYSFFFEAENPFVVLFFVSTGNKVGFFDRTACGIMFSFSNV